jgi:hypothetical protein
VKPVCGALKSPSQTATGVAAIAASDNEQTMAEIVRFEVRIVDTDMSFLPIYIYDMHYHTP